jgi:hypothetical protein
VINIFTPNLKDIVAMISRSPDWPFDKPDSPFMEFVDRATFSSLFNAPEPDEQAASWGRNAYLYDLQNACYRSRTIADTVAAAAEQAGLMLVPRQPSPRMADAVRQLLQTNPSVPFEEIWAAAALAAAADQEIWAAAFATATEVAKMAADTAAAEREAWSALHSQSEFSQPDEAAKEIDTIW